MRKSASYARPTAPQSAREKKRRGQALPRQARLRAASLSVPSQPKRRTGEKKEKRRETIKCYWFPFFFFAGFCFVPAPFFQNSTKRIRTLAPPFFSFFFFSTKQRAVAAVALSVGLARDRFGSLLFPSVAAFLNGQRKSTTLFFLVLLSIRGACLRAHASYRPQHARAST
nr:hypothetical protein [Pandoravirus aubagnensis]